MAGSRLDLRTRLEHAVDRHSVPVGAWLLRHTRGRIVRLWHRRALVLTTTGRRSGLPRTVFQFFPRRRGPRGGRGQQRPAHRPPTDGG